MPSASLSPNPPSAMPPSPRQGAAGGGVAGGAVRPPLMKRQSSASSHSSRQVVVSPGSVGDPQPLRHPVKSRHTKIILPRNHSSGRNLAKLNRQAQNATAHAVDDGRKHSRQRSHEGDTEIRLPGSLDESSNTKPPMRRNLTAYQLPRNSSHAKLKKNLSHGQLTRLGSGRNLAALNSTAHRAPPSPGLKGKSKRPKSAEMTGLEKEQHEVQLELARQQQGQPGWKAAGKKVGFAVGSVGDASGEEDIPEMEGSGLQEDEWTEESASASPYSTRQNTANNSRRESMVVAEKASERLPLTLEGKSKETRAANIRWEGHSAQGKKADKSESEGSEPPSPHSAGPVEQEQQVVSRPVQEPTHQSETTDWPQYQIQNSQTQSPQHAEPPMVASQRRVSQQVREHQNPTTRRLLDKSQQMPAPALVSNISALDDVHSSRGSPAPSLRSSKSNIGEGGGDGQEDELVSRFVPSTSHPSMGSSANTAQNTPKQSGFHTPTEESTSQPRETHMSGFQVGPVSPGSTVSGSSGATTPAVQRSRTELRMLQEKAMADLETAANARPHLPAHVYDRRNESLKSYLHMATVSDGRASYISPDVFQGRFRALNTELRVVQKYRDPLGEAVARLKACKGSVLYQHTAASKQQGAGLTSSKSAISLPQQRAQRAADLSKSASPPKSALPTRRGMNGTAGAGGMQIQSGLSGERQRQRREVSFAQTPPETREFVPADEELTPEAIVRRLWASK